MAAMKQRALVMPKQINNAEREAIQRKLGWVPESLNVGLAMRNGAASFWSQDVKIQVRGHQPLVSNLDRLQLEQRVSGRDHLNQALTIYSKTHCLTSF